MVCQEGHSDWIGTTNGACFATRQGDFQNCFCPISTCTREDDGYYSCRFTYLSYFVIYGLAIALVALSVAYYQYEKRVKAALRRKIPEVLDWKHVSDVMFGVYHTSGDSANPSPRKGDGATTQSFSSVKREGAPVEMDPLSDGERKGLLVKSGRGENGLSEGTERGSEGEEGRGVRASPSYGSTSHKWGQQ